ncbi:MAG: membrane protein insertion efficiency factor YidD [candidate division Zixibacteria bacterium]|nr:membrane protein insertion efficiency factor YidD [candidate division Zixibacteria bacterium]
MFAIYVYRFTLSPFIGRSCRFYPTCSHYAEDALRKYGAMRGIGLAIKRLAKCHPWHEGGFDPVN